MIKLDKLSNNGNPIVMSYEVSSGNFAYSDFAEINFKEARPPSKMFTTTDAATGGSYDHIFGVVDVPLNGGTNFISSDIIEATSGSHWLLDFATAAGASVGSAFPTVALVYFVVTEIEYVAFNTTTAKVYMHTGLDVYVTLA